MNMLIVQIVLTMMVLAALFSRDALLKHMTAKAFGIGTTILLAAVGVVAWSRGDLIGVAVVAPILPYQLISRDAQIALTEFNQSFMQAFAAPPPDMWAGEIGLGITVAPGAEVRFPIPISAAGYKEFSGDVKYRALAEKSLKIKTRLFQDGVEELARIIEAPDFIGWGQEPARIALAAQHLPLQLIAQLLEARANDEASPGNPGPCDLDGVDFFSGTKFDNGDHPFNVLKVGAGKFGNNFTKAGVGFATTPSEAVITYAAQSFRRIKNPSGLPAGYKLTHVIAPPEQERIWVKLLQQDTIIQSIDGGSTFGAVDNVWKGAVKLLIADQLKDTGKFYTAAANKAGCVPWMFATEGAPETIINDKTSARYKDKLTLSIAYILAANGALALPHCIQRWSGEA